MGRIIRRTVTITITETWTITWTMDAAQADNTAPPSTTVVPDQPKAQGEPDETMLPTVTPGPTNTQPLDISPQSGAGSQRKRTRRRRAAE